MSTAILAATLRAHRQRRGLSQAALARASGVSQSTISRIEAGLRASCGVERLARLAEALGITIDELLRAPPRRRRAA